MVRHRKPCVTTASPQESIHVHAWSNLRRRPGSYPTDGKAGPRIGKGKNKVEYTYDGNGNELTITNPMGITVTNTYDSSDNRTSAKDPLGNTTRYTYDGTGNQLTVTDPLGNTNTNAYDATAPASPRPSAEPTISYPRSMSGTVTTS